MSLRLVPVTIQQADAFVDRFHRHNDPAVRVRFAVGVADETGLIRGVALAGNPKARMLNDGYTLEVVRCCTDGARNACSMLYRACARAAKAMGFLRVITYTLDAEDGASLKAAGFVRSTSRQRLPGKATSWQRGRDQQRAEVSPSRFRDEHEALVKARWEIEFGGEALEPLWPEDVSEPTLFEGLAS